MTDQLKAFEKAIQPLAGLAAITYRLFRAEHLPRILCYLLTVVLVVSLLDTTRQQQAPSLEWLSKIQYREAA